MKSDSGGIRRTPASIPLSGKTTATALLAAFLILRGAAQGQTVEKSLTALGSSPTLGSSNAHVAIVSSLTFNAATAKSFGPTRYLRLKRYTSIRARRDLPIVTSQSWGSLPSRQLRRPSAPANKGNFGDTMIASLPIKAG
jgi:hypothetical protein